MRRDVSEIRAFYASPLGQTAVRLIGAKLKDAWGSVAALDVLGVGYAAPWLDSMGDARRAVCAMPWGQGAESWPAPGRCRAALVHDDALPFPTGLFDRILAVHALEEAADPLALTRELGRVLAPSGRLILAVAARGGLWARAEATPFGHGRPYTRGQVERLAREADLEPLAWSQALYGPPWPGLVGWAEGLERWGGRLTPGAGGVVLLEAVKSGLVLRPVGAAAEPARLEPALAAQPAGLAPAGSRAMEIPDEAD